MSDINPYQSPQAKGTLDSRPAIKRGLGFATILALTPVAVFGAFFTSCWTAIFLIDPPTRVPDWVAGTICIGPPACVLVGMTIWAVRARRRQRAVTLQPLNEPRSNSGPPPG